jgi:hypothetical protein
MFLCKRKPAAVDCPEHFLKRVGAGPTLQLSLTIGKTSRSNYTFRHI